MVKIASAQAHWAEGTVKAQVELTKLWTLVPKSELNTLHWLPGGLRFSRTGGVTVDGDEKDRWQCIFFFLEMALQVWRHDDVMKRGDVLRSPYHGEGMMRSSIHTVVTVWKWTVFHGTGIVAIMPKNVEGVGMIILKIKYVWWKVWWKYWYIATP